VFVHSTGDVVSDQSHCVGLLFKERFSDGKITYKGTDPSIPSCATLPFTTNCIWHGIEPCRVGLNHPASLKLVRSTKPVVWIDALLNGSQLVHIFSKYLSLSVIVRLDFETCNIPRPDYETPHSLWADSHQLSTYHRLSPLRL
jgi:hypothetical protein